MISSIIESSSFSALDLNNFILSILSDRLCLRAGHNLVLQSYYSANLTVCTVVYTNLSVICDKKYFFSNNYCNVL